MKTNKQKNPKRKQDLIQERIKSKEVEGKARCIEGLNFQQSEYVFQGLR